MILLFWQQLEGLKFKLRESSCANSFAVSAKGREGGMEERKRFAN